MNKNKAIFLDRDGIINEEIGDYITRLEDFKLLPSLCESLKILVDQGFLLIIITNQGGLAKNLYSVDELNKMHNYFSQELKKHDAIIAEFYYCRHHPNFNGDCICRKPDSGMLEKAISRFQIDPAQSFMFGDKQRDMDAAAKVGVKGILLESNELIGDFFGQINFHEL